MIALYIQTITAFTIVAIQNGWILLFSIEKFEHNWTHSLQMGPVWTTKVEEARKTKCLLNFLRDA